MKRRLLRAAVSLGLAATIAVTLVPSVASAAPNNGKSNDLAFVKNDLLPRGLGRGIPCQ